MKYNVFLREIWSPHICWNSPNCKFVVINKDESIGSHKRQDVFLAGQAKGCFCKYSTQPFAILFILQFSRHFSYKTFLFPPFCFVLWQSNKMANIYNTFHPCWTLDREEEDIKGHWRIAWLIVTYVSNHNTRPRFLLCNIHNFIRTSSTSKILCICLIIISSLFMTFRSIFSTFVEFCNWFWGKLLYITTSFTYHWTGVGNFPQFHQRSW